MPLRRGKSGKELFSQFGRVLKQSAESLVQETRELTRVGKLKVELLTLENDRKKKFEEIGRLAHTLYKQEADFGPLDDHFKAVDEIEAEIDTKNEEIKRTSASEDDLGEKETEAEVAVDTEEEVVHTKWCSQCGVPVGEEDKFCSNCGNPLN